MEAVAAAIGTAFLNSAVDLLVQKLGSPLVLGFFKRRKLDEGLLEKLAETLNSVNGLLTDAEEKEITEAAVKNWLDDVKVAVYEAEDLLDEIDYEALRSELDAGGPQTSTDQVRNFFSSLKSPFNKEKDQMVENLEKIFQRLERLEKKAHTLHLIRRVGERTQSKSVPTTSPLGGSRVFGRDDALKTIIKLLLSDDAQRKSLEVIPIVGMGGIGKTTLAKFVYNDSEVQRGFDLKAWAYVSQDFDVLKLTKDILKEVGARDCDSMTDNQLHCELEKKLMGNKLLLVLDDVWSDDQVKWDFLLTPLKSALRGSKIVITTRDKGVASILPSVSPYHLLEISDDACWSLFSEHAFSSQNSNVISQFEEMFRPEVVRRCGGLPLAARSLGSLLKSETDVGKWKKILKSNLWDLRKDQILPVLRVSYYYLPSHLKRCFAYCAILPKGYSFSKMQIIHLWIAEGFFSPIGVNKGMEEAGSEYFEDLVSRSFFEHDRSSYFFTMHDCTNDLAKFVSGEFFLSMAYSNSWFEFSSKTRHVSYSSGTDLKNLEGIDEVKNLRTFLIRKVPPVQLPSYYTDRLFDPDIRIMDQMMLLSRSMYVSDNTTNFDSLLPKFERLRVLSLSAIKELPDSIGNLKHLRYLNLSKAAIEILPETLVTLYHLQILILQGCCLLVKLPANMMKLINLYHLDITGTSLLEMPPQMGKLTKLQSLTDFFVGKQNGSNIKELGQLRCLGGVLCIRNLQNVFDAQDALEANLEGKRDLKGLELIWSGDSDDSVHQFTVIERLKPCTNLEGLAIIGYGGTKFPDWVGHSSFSNIVALKLYRCNYCHSLPPLGQLASLNKLSIEEFGEVIAIDSEFYGNCASTKNPFESLESLTFTKMWRWCEWIPYTDDNDGRAFPSLQRLCVVNCPDLTALPVHLPSLEVEIASCPQLEQWLLKNPTIHKMKLISASIDRCEIVDVDEESGGEFQVIQTTELCLAWHHSSK